MRESKRLWYWIRLFMFLSVITKRRLFLRPFQETEPSISRLVLIINSFPYWPRSMRTSPERSVGLRCWKVIGITFNLQLRVCLCVICVQLWQGRWQGDEIIVKVLQVRDWTTRKSRDFNEEHPKLRYVTTLGCPVATSWGTLWNVVVSFNSHLPTRTFTHVLGLSVMSF